jgi:hypothetical protein
LLLQYFLHKGTLQEEKLKLAENQSIRDLATTDTALMPFFTPLERAIIEVCKMVVEESGGNKVENESEESHEVSSIEELKKRKSEGALKLLKDTEMVEKIKPKIHKKHNWN